jgi:hypothetical protein
LTQKSSDWELTNTGSKYHGLADFHLISAAFFLITQEFLTFQDLPKVEAKSSQVIVSGPRFALRKVGFRPQRSMVLKIERISGRRRTRIRLSGDFRSEHLVQVQAEIRRGGTRVALDLEEVELVDVEGIRFLNMCNAKGVAVLHRSPYIKEWMFRERREAKKKVRDA